MIPDGKSEMQEVMESKEIGKYMSKLERTSICILKGNNNIL